MENTTEAKNLAEIARLATVLQRALVKLKALEWSFDLDANQVCPECGTPQSHGIHASDCELAEMIDAPRSDAPTPAPIPHDPENEGFRAWQGK